MAGPESGGDSGLRVWIDQDLCTGDGLCTDIVPEIFEMGDDGLAYVKDGQDVYDGSGEFPAGAKGTVPVPAELLDATLEAAEDCPGFCIFIDPITE